MIKINYIKCGLLQDMDISKMFGCYGVTLSGDYIIADDKECACNFLEYCCGYDHFCSLHVIHCATNFDEYK